MDKALVAGARAPLRSTVTATQRSFFKCGFLKLIIDFLAYLIHYQ